MNRTAWEKTLETGQVHYWSRSRDELWHKGGTSGHVQLVKEIWIDCDDDTILIKIEQLGGGACHTGYRSCFYRKREADGTVTVQGEKGFDPREVYSQ
jgi:phosphoribosyl-AMP cyclohydrolase